MEKIKLTKGELKRQRDALAQFERYLPTLQLKKQQLQMEILAQIVLREEKERLQLKRKAAMETWIGLLSRAQVEIKPWLKPKGVVTSTRNIAGVDIPVFEQVEFVSAEYDLFTTPLWVDNALESLRAFIVQQEEIKVIQRGVAILRQELRVTTQRVNLFEKVKIPEAKEAIRLIKIYLGDQMANAVGRSKIAKNKIERVILEEARV
jgi:V/A-type H+-transporting ATPase subunit D